MTFDELLKLEDGWYNGDGKAPDKLRTRYVQSMIQKFGGRFPMPSVFPTYEGNILLEWTTIDSLPSLEIDTNIMSGEFLSKYHEKTFDLSILDKFNESIESIISLIHLSKSIDDIFLQLDKFKTLDKNWDSYGADPIDLQSIELSKIFILGILKHDISPSYVFPSRSSEVIIEYQIDDNLLIDVVIDSSKQSFEEMDMNIIENNRVKKELKYSLKEFLNRW